MQRTSILENSEPEPHCELCYCGHLLFFLEDGVQKSSEGIRAFLDIVAVEDGRDYQWTFKQLAARYDSKGHLKFSPLRRDTFKDLQQHLKKSKRTPYSLTLGSGPSPYGVSDRAFEIFDNGSDVSYLRYVFPAQTLKEKPQSFVSMSKLLAEQLKYRSGYLGFAVNQMYGLSTLMTFANSPLGKVSKKYFCVDVRTNLEVFGRFEQHGHTNFGWITYFRGQQPRQKFPAGVTCFKSGKGWALQVDECPVLGTKSETTSLRLYRKCANLLSSKLAPEEIFGEYDLIGGTKLTKRWVTRFFI